LGDDQPARPAHSISAQAHLDLDDIFNAYEADPDLWVAILTGADNKAFCAGADFKGAAKSGRRSRLAALPALPAAAGPSR